MSKGCKQALGYFNLGNLSIVSVVVAGSLAMNSTPAQAANAFWDGSTINGSVNLWIRDRERVPGLNENGHDKHQQPNLVHGSLYGSLAFNSGYAWNLVGLDLTAYGTMDLYNDASPDHEMNFWDVNNPYDKVPKGGCPGAWDSECTQDSVTYQTAAVKFMYGEGLRAKAGYFQPSVPTTLGVNWSYAAGSYLGGEVGYTYDNLQLGAAYAVKYKAPWFEDVYEFREADGKGDAGDAYSFGLRYTFDKGWLDGVLVDTAYGALTKGDRKNAHLKLKKTFENNLYLSGQVYYVSDDKQYDGDAYQFALLSAKSFGPYSMRAEMTYTVANSLQSDTIENFTYRLTKQYGGSNGAYDIWWNNRSDWNHDEETAGFLELKRDFSDYGLNGLTAGVSGAIGYADAPSSDIDDLLEYSGSVFAYYTLQSTFLKGSTAGIYYTAYENETDAGNWYPYTNLFQDEQDIKFTLSMPFSIK